MAKLTSHSIAIVLLPPPRIAAVVDTLRCANDKSWPRWSAHITLLFPFGTVENFPEVMETLRSALANPELQRFQLTLDKVARFATSDYETVYLGTSNPAPVEALWSTIIESLNYEPRHNAYVPHMTLGQTAQNTDSIAVLTDKGNRLLERHDLSWLVDHVALLRKREDLEGAMEVFAQFPIGPNADFVPVGDTHFGTPSFHFDGSSWIPAYPSPHSQHTSLTIATYNILHHPAFPFSSRFPAVLDAVLASNADIICLQEVDDDSLSLILHNEQVHGRYTWCTRSDNSVMESERNVVMLATEEFGFEWVRVQLGGKHKACVVASLGSLNCQSGKSVVVAGVHLSAGRSAALASKRREEITTLLSYLREHHATDEWIVIGDVNWPGAEDFPSPDILMDVWAETIGAGGATYDPTNNPLAAATTKEGRLPERYDRLFVKRNGQMVARAKGLELFGIPEEGKGVGSDHWGLKAVVDLRNDEEPRPRNVHAPLPTPTLRLLPTVVTDDHLRELCAEKQCFPTETHNIVFQKAVDVLRGFLVIGASPLPADDTSPAPSPVHTPGVQLVLVPVGSFAIGCHTQDSDIDCIVIGNLNTQTFWRLMRWKIRTLGNEGRVRLRRFVKDALVQMMVLDVEGVKIDLQYCPAAKLVECWNDFAQIPRDSPLFSLPVSTLRTLNAHRDVLALLRALPSLDAFRLAHRALRLFLSHRGIFGARFGYVGGFHLTVLLARICLQAPPEACASQLVRMFFRVYAQWDWDNNAVAVPIAGVDIASYRRTNREPMVVLSVEKPRVNMTANASSNSVEVLKLVFLTTDRAFENGASWSEIYSVEDDDLPFRSFVNDHEAFVKVGVTYWGSSCMRGRALIGWLESRFVGLLVQLHANAPTIRAHLWPARFADESAADHQYLNGFYLIGLSASPVLKAGEGPTTGKANANVENNLETTLRSFEGEIHDNTRYYDPTEMFISVTHVTFSQLPLALVLDNHRWSDGGYDEAVDEDTDSDDMVDTVDDDGRDFLTLSAAALKKKRVRSKATSYLPASKLRKSSDVYHRLIWDPAASKDDYVIGYEDRFVGIKEIPLGSWNREVVDETFIPFHRVVYFRRKGDNVIVWDRKKKIDLVFGSGIKPERQ